jgi:hypothetical protein
MVGLGLGCENAGVLRTVGLYRPFPRRRGEVLKQYGYADQARRARVPNWPGLRVLGRTGAIGPCGAGEPSPLRVMSKLARATPSATATSAP